MFSMPKSCSKNFWFELFCCVTFKYKSFIIRILLTLHISSSTTICISVLRLFISEHFSSISSFESAHVFLIYFVLFQFLFLFFPFAIFRFLFQKLNYFFITFFWVSICLRLTVLVEGLEKLSLHIGQVRPTLLCWRLEFRLDEQLILA